VRLFDVANAKINVQLGTDTLTVQTTETVTATTPAVSTGTGAFNTEIVSFGFDVGARGHYLAKDLNSDGITDLVSMQLQDRGGGETRLQVSTYLGRSTGTGFTELSSDRVDLTSNEWLGGDWLAFQARFDSGNNVVVNAQIEPGFGTSGTFVINAAGVITGYTGPGFTGSNESSRDSIGADFNGDGVTDFVEDDLNPTSFQFRIQQTTTTPGSSTTTSAIAASVSTNASASVATRTLALSALDTFNTVQTLVSNTRATVGTSLARIEVAGRVSSATQLEYNAAEDRIRSADVAKEAADLARLTITRDAAQSILGQANQQPALALSLLR
jgi:flagellin-like hook-associated protein FlgL